MAAAVDIYKDSGGKASIPLIKVTGLRLTKIHWDKFIRPDCYMGVPVIKPKRTFMGMVEKKTKGKYDWAGGRTKKPFIYGSFGKRQPKGKTGGTYDKHGPSAIGFARIKFIPYLSWFKKYSISINVAAKARPYGGRIDTAIQSQEIDVSDSRTEYVEDEDGNIEEVTETESYSQPKQSFALPWGSDTFKAKLVPLKY